MLTGEDGRGLAHLLHIHLVVQHGDIAPVEHRLHLAHKAGVAVRLAQGIVPGVKTLPRLLHLPHGDGIGEIAVHIVPDLLTALRHIQPHRGHHGPGVDAGIGTPRADHIHRCAVQLFQHALQLALDRLPVRLALPAEKAGAVIGDGQLVVLLHIVALRSSLPLS